MVVTETLEIPSEGDFYALNITDQVARVIVSSGIKEGHVLVYYQHTTGCILVVEHEAGMLVDMQDVLDRVVPPAYDYKHHRRGHDTNGAAHVRAGLLSPSLTVPISAGRMLLGEWQEILMIDFDEKAAVRKLVLQVQGE